MPSHWKKAVQQKPAFLRVPYQTKVFELQDVQKINTAIQKNSLKKKIALTRVHA
jgi:hypothetical protein